ncbi:unnamed protein product [Scytosiphon promiscuus]
MTVEAILAANVLGGLIDAANGTLLAPVFVLLKGLLGAVRGAAAAREEIVELARYCVGISRCLLEAAKMEHMPSTIVVALGEFKAEMEAVGKFVRNYSTRAGGFLRRMAFTSRDRNAVAGHKQKLKDLLDAVSAGLAVETFQGLDEVKAMIKDRDPPPLPDLAEVPREVPNIPPTYVERVPLHERVVRDLVDPQRSPSATHCVLGMGGGGKTLLAASVARDDRVRAAFKNGIFWILVGKEENDVASLLEYLAVQLARAPTSTPHRCPHQFGGAEEAVRHLSAVVEKHQLRCLVVLDNVWSTEVVSTFARTGLHILVTTRRKTAVSPGHAGGVTVVGDMSEGDALEVLRRASQASGPLPGDAAQVVRDCGFLPLALGMVGKLARDQPLDPCSWRRLHDNLQGKSSKFRRLENGKLFSSIETSLRGLPNAQQEQLQLMAVMASGVAVTPEMLANLWAQHISDVATGACILVSHCLLQDTLENYRLHDLVLEYLQLVIKMDDDQTLAERASSRQARYLGRLDVLEMHVSRGESISNGGLYCLISLWNSVKKLDGRVDVKARYAESLHGVTKIRTWREVAHLLMLLDNYSGAETILNGGMTAVGEEVEKIIANGASDGPAELAVAAKLGVELVAVLDELASARIKQGNYQKADALFEGTIDRKERHYGPDSPALAISLGVRANGLAEQGKYDEADLLYRRSIEIQEEALGPDDLSLAFSLHNRANMLLSQGKLEEADQLLLRSIDIKERHLGSDHPRLASSLGNRGRILVAQGNYDEADLLYRRAVEIDEKVLGADSLGLAAHYTNRANMLWEQGKYAEADLISVRAIELKEKHLRRDHPDLAISLGARANILTAQGKGEEAELLYRRIIEIQEKGLGDDHPILAGSLNNLASLISEQGNHTEADLLFLRAIDIQEKHLGPDHPDLGKIFFGRALHLTAQGDYDQAETLYRRAIEVEEKSRGNGHARLVEKLFKSACVLAWQGERTEADLLYRVVIDAQEKQLGPDDLSLATSLGNRAALLTQQGQYEEAVALRRRSLKIKEGALGLDHLSLAGSLNNQANVLSTQGKHAEADSLYLRAIGIQEKQLGADHPSLVTNLENRAKVLESQEEYEEADALRLRAIGIKAKAVGSDHLSLVGNANDRARVLCRRGMYAKADSVYAWIVPIQEKHLGLNHPTLGTSLANRAVTLDNLGRYIDADTLFRRSIDVFERAFGPDHPDIGFALANRAVCLKHQGKLEEAILLYMRAVDIVGKALRAGGLNVGMIYEDVELWNFSQGKVGDPRRVLESALAIRRMAAGERQEDSAKAIASLKHLDESQASE